MRRSMGNRSSGGNMGPLMTDHLNDLDRELELLKRKRQMIEQQQQQLIVTDRQFNRLPQNYNSPSNSAFGRPQYNDVSSMYKPNLDYGHLYDERCLDPQSGFARKRPANRNDMPRGSPAKRYSGPPSRPKKSGYVGGPNRGPSGNGASFSQPPNKRKRPNQLSSNSNQGKVTKPSSNSNQGRGTKPSSNFNQGKVTKPLKSGPVKKQYPFTERKNLVAKAAEIVPKEAEDDESITLKADVAPTPLMNGRMEFCLGNIFKEIKRLNENNEEYKSIFDHNFKGRVLKQILRARLRDAMMGKVVKNYTLMHAEYRKMFPTESDNDLLKEVLNVDDDETIKRLIIKLEETDDPKVFFKRNMYKLLNVRLNYMFTKVKKIIQEDNDKNIDDLLAEVDFDNKIIEGQDVKDTKNESINIENDISKLEETKDEKNNESLEKDPKAEAEKAETETAEVANATNEPIVDNDIQNKTLPEDGKADKVNDVSIDDIPMKKELLEKKRKYYMDLMDALLKWKLPQLILNNKETILKLFELDRMYMNTKRIVTLKTVEKATALVKTREENAAEERRPLTYFVKVVGVPKLPKRPVMRCFLDDFKPASIKKHKFVHNLLFVGFASKEDYDKCLQADGSVVGTSTISISVSEAKKKKDGEEVGQDSETTDAKPAAGGDDSDIISSELDDQIENLLSSIRENDTENESALDESTQDESALDETALDETALDADITADSVASVETANNNAAVTLDTVMEEQMENGATDETGDNVVGNGNADEKQPAVAPNTEVKGSAVSTPTKNVKPAATSTPGSVMTRRSSRIAKD